jgi:pimeloyl-ACP methyl ester carboxylesterase
MKLISTPFSKADHSFQREKHFVPYARARGIALTVFALIVGVANALAADRVFLGKTLSAVSRYSAIVLCSLAVLFGQGTASAANLSAPTLSAPYAGATGVSTTPTFSWSAVTGATAGYFLAVASTSGALPTLPTDSTCPSCVSMVAAAGTSATLPSALNAGTPYYWRVRGRGPGSIYGNWSNIFSFTTAQTTHTPTITKVAPSGDPAISTGQNLNFQVSCADPDANLQTVNWYVNGALDHSTQVSGSSASASWSRTFSTAGSFNIGAQVGDSTGLSSELAWIVTVTDSTLTAPTLSAPSNGATGVSTTPTFSWSAVTGATAGYFLAVASTSGALPTLPTDSTCPSCVSMVAAAGTSATLPSALNAGTTYYWRVRGRGPGSIYGNWSNIFSFSTAQTTHPPTITKVAPGGDPAISTGQNLNFQVSCADQDGNLQTVNWYVNGALDHSTSISGSSASASWSRTFSTAGSFNIGAQVGDSTGLSSELAWIVTVTDSTLTAPTLSAPSNGATGVSTTPTFSWSAVTGATAGYFLAVASTSGALPTLPTDSTCPSCVSMVAAAGTSATLPSALNAGTPYYWRVRGRGPGSIYGNWSNIFSFTTASVAQYGNISARLKNINGTDAPTGAGTPHFKLYTSPLQELSGTNPETFSNIPVGTYLLEGFQTGTFWGEEFWNSQQVTVAAGATTNAVLTRQYPYATSVVMKNVETGATITPGQTIPAGTQVRFEVTVKNDVPSTPLSTQVHFVLDFNQGTPFDYDWPLSPAQVIAGSGGTYTFTTAINGFQTGQFYFALQVRTDTGTSVVPTDSWTWTQACGIGRISTISGLIDPPFGYLTPTLAFIQRYPAGTTARIDPNLRTWIIIHGDKGSSTDPWVTALAGAIAGIYPTNQILLLDWSDAASDPGIPLNAEDWIQPVAGWASRKLADYGFAGSDLNLIGHSWGGHMTDELAERILGGVNTIVALDPAENGSGLYNPEDSGQINFRGHSQSSWAFHSSLLGSAITPTSAHEAFIVDTGLNLVFGEAHIAVVNLFTYMLTHPAGGVSSQFQLNRLLAHQSWPWTPNLFTTSFQQGAAFEFPTGGYEGRIGAVLGGQSPNFLEYYDSLSQKQVVWETTDTTPPTVTTNQAAGQSDPTSSSPINFTVVFSEAVTGFASGNVTLGGTAGATGKSVTGSGTTYNVAVSGMTQSGTVTATIPAGAAQDGAGNPSLASTSSDNSVTYNAPDITAPACTYSIAPTSAPGFGAGGSGSVQVTGSPSGCTGSWSASASSTGGWLTLTGTNNSSGAGTWQVPFSYPANPSTTSSRSGTVSFTGSFPSGNTFTLTQGPATATACTYSIAPTSAPGSGAGGSGSVQVTGSPSGCTGSWSASASSTGGWLTLTGTNNSSGAGTWQVPFSYPANPSTTSSRSGTVSFTGSFPSGTTFTLTQSPATAGSCNYSIAPTSAPGSASAGSGSVQVTGSPSGCTGSWSAVASSTGSWLTLTGTTNGTGPGTVQVLYSYGANPSTTATRSGTISFSGSLSATFTLTQDAAVVIGGGSDACSSAVIVSGTSFTNAQTTTSATTDASDPTPCAGGRNASVWYRYTAPSTGVVTVDTIESGYDTVLSAWTGSCGALTPVPGGCDDDSGGNLTSSASFSATAGTTYYFMVTSYGGSGGSLTFHLNFVPAETSGTINVNATFNGVAWSGPVNYQITGTASYNGSAVPNVFNSAPAGGYTLNYLSGGPANATLAGIQPSANLSLSGAGSITWTLQFTSGASCTYSLSCSTVDVGSGAGTGTCVVTAPSGCAWTASSNATSWLTTTSTGNGNGTVTFNYTANTGASRTGIITVQGQTITVTQAGTTPPAPTISAIAPASGTTGGGTPVSITGTNFASGASVTIGGTVATSITVVSSTQIAATTPAHAAGAVNVIVTNADAQSATLASGFTFVVPAPTISAIVPTSGTTAGGTAVNITGTNFASGASVTIGGTAATSITVGSSTQITATTPAHAAGAVNVIVTNADAQSATLASGFTYVAPAPTISAIAPTSGTTAGGTPVTITGTNFASGASVMIGGTAATSVTVVSSMQITATTPAHGAGAVNVVVTNPDAQSATLASGFTFVVPAPTITAVTPTAGTTAGGTAVTITGTNFASGASVTIGGTAATSVTVVSSTQITATTPAHGAGAVNVVVTNADAQSATLTSGFTFVVPAPTITAITPTSGTTAGGTAATITGANFNSGASVTIGGAAATSVTVVSSTQITATTPAHAAVAANVVVANPDAQSATLTSGFTFVVPAPTITAITPTSGTTTGGTAVTITGTNFASGASVTIGGTAATSVTVVSSTQITATTPAHAAGAANVVVTNADAQSATLASGFTFVVPAPTISAIAPTSGTAVGGTAVTITGMNFASGASVTIGGTAATSVTVVSSTQITATTPAHAAGAVNVVVTNPDAQSATLASGFTYVAAALPGDANGDGQVTVADVFYLINNLFAGGPGAVAGDANGDGQVTVADVFYLINYLFAGGPAPH